MKKLMHIAVLIIVASFFMGLSVDNYRIAAHRVLAMLP